MEESVFAPSETEKNQISAGVYNLVIGLTLIWGFAVNWWMVLNIPVESIRSINSIYFYAGYFASCLFGVYLYACSENPIVSFIGYNFVVVPFGFIINLAISQYNSDLVLEAVRVTGMVTFVMMLLGSMYPKFFSHIAGGLLIALICVIIVELIEIYFFHTRHGILDWIVVLIFCGYIGHDWAKANSIPKTFDNAVDSAASLYMDIINLFLRILRILGRK